MVESDDRTEQIWETLETLGNTHPAKPFWLQTFKFLLSSRLLKLKHNRDYCGYRLHASSLLFNNVLKEILLLLPHIKVNTIIDGYGIKNNVASQSQMSDILYIL